jgi:hypothetical protein
MTDPAAQPQPTPNPSTPRVTVTNPPPNNLGLAGFIISILGLISCGVLAPIGLIVSLIGLTKRPRGFAIAGTIIGIIGSVFLALVGVGIVLGLLGLGAAAKHLQEVATTHEQAMKLYVDLDQQRQRGGAALDATAANAVAARYNDGWGTPLRAVVAGDAIDILSAGRDKQFDTDDDVRFDQLALQAATQPAATQPGGDFGGDGDE